MSPERKKLVERAVLNKVRRELFQHKAPLSLYALADRIRSVEMEIDSEDFESVDEIHDSPEGFLTTQVRYELEFDDLADVVQSATAPDIYLNEDKVGLKYFWENEIYKLTIAFLQDESIKVGALIKYLSKVINAGTTILPIELLNKNNDKNSKTGLERIVASLINQYPKIFRLDSEQQEVRLIKKTDLRLNAASFIFRYGKTTWDKDDRVSEISKLDLLQLLNESDFYFKDYQKSIDISDINGLIKLNGNWFEDRKEDIIFKHLSPIRERLKSYYQQYGHPNRDRAIIVFYFIGNDFPIKEAETFVKLKRVVNVRLFSWNSYSQIDDFINPQKNLFEFWPNLRMILPKDTDYIAWIKKNIAMSRVYDYDLPYTLEQIYPEMILYYSPILNLDDNPGNLFKMSIQEKIEQYKSETA